jgi:D-alanine-D-alanine ligase
MRIQKAIIFHSKLGPNPPADELDVLDEAAFFEEGLRIMDTEVLKLPFENDLEINLEMIRRFRPDIVVNLVETIFGDGKLVHLAPALFEHVSVPFTGCSSESIYITSNKVLSKNLLKTSGIPTPDCFEGNESFKTSFSGKKFLIKSVWEHASFGMDEHNPVFIDEASVILERLQTKNSGQKSFFAEQYIEGREFNVSVIGNGKNPVVLPIAEIKFTDYPMGKPRIVGYRAKWDEESFEYRNTVRHFLDEDSEIKLVKSIREICLQCWKIFDLRGYARVDFRLDDKGNLFVLEINANPCISKNSGFVAAASRLGLSCENIVNSIVRDTFRNI